MSLHVLAQYLNMPSTLIPGVCPSGSLTETESRNVQHTCNLFDRTVTVTLLPQVDHG